MKIKAAVLSAVVSITAFSVAPRSSGQVLFSDDFDGGFSDLNWLVSKSLGDSDANFAFNYADLGIPTAPHSVGGSTVGLRFLVNQEAGQFQAISAAPIDQHFTGDFRIKFDLWLNFTGPLEVGGLGSTQLATFGWGTSGTTTQWPSSKHSMMFAGTTDGQSNQDYRAYLNEYAGEGGATISPTTGFYSAGTVATGADDARQDTNAYYASLGGKTAPDAQLLAFPGQTGTTAPGALGFAWREMIIEKIGDVVSWSIDGLPIASVPITNFEALGGDNIFVGFSDINNSSSPDPNDFLNAAIFDNIVVEVIPEPASACLLALGAAALCTRRRRAT